MVTYLGKRALLRIEALSHTCSTLLAQIHHHLHTGQPYDEHKASVAIANNPRTNAQVTKFGRRSG